MKFYLAKLLQLIGITTVGFGLMYGLTNSEGLRFELRMLMVGSGAFLVGRLIEGRGAA
ncbi:MAG: hypothetical protein P8R42_22105 [Candidatus Binatia bacterium]|nr:hypothetical protein [Candidatus Binatia bacterium]